ncbi:MAG: GNA1162 family protein [Curvibacter sp.]
MLARFNEHFRTNGRTVADDIHRVSPGKLREVFGADAALYIEITDYGTRYFVVGSASIVSAEARLVDLRTGQQLWTGRATASSEEGQNDQGGLASLLIGALVKQMVGTVADQSYTVSKITAVRLLSANSPGALLSGPRSPNYKK